MPQKAAVEDDASSMRRQFLELILSRQSVSPKRLGPPGPTYDEVAMMVSAAVTAPDHGALRPWRFILIELDSRSALADLFQQAKARLSPGATPEELERERQRALRAPTLLAVVARLQRHEPRVEERDQYASIGAAIQNILLVAHALGYGAIMLSGRKTRDPQLVSALGLSGQEELMGFICIGTPTTSISRKCRPNVSDHLTVWRPT